MNNTIAYQTYIDGQKKKADPREKEFLQKKEKADRDFDSLIQRCESGEKIEPELIGVYFQICNTADQALLGMGYDLDKKQFNEKIVSHSHEECFTQQQLYALEVLKTLKPARKK